MNRLHEQFEQLDVDENWQAISGYPDGIEQLVLSNNFDEGAYRGRRSRLVRFHAGVATSEPFAHTYWEEVFLIEGDIECADDKGVFQSFVGPSYAKRPPDTAHGPFRSKSGCLLFEIHYFGSE